MRRGAERQDEDYRKAGGKELKIGDRESKMETGRSKQKTSGWMKKQRS